MNESLTSTRTWIADVSMCDGVSGNVVQPAGAPRPATAAGIASEDWDLLFRAALELLARIAIERPAPDGLGTHLQAPGTALRECIEALDRLRTSRCEAMQP